MPPSHQNPTDFPKPRFYFANSADRMLSSHWSAHIQYQQTDTGSRSYQKHIWDIFATDYCDHRQ